MVQRSKSCRICESWMQKEKVTHAKIRIEFFVSWLVFHGDVHPIKIPICVKNHTDSTNPKNLLTEIEGFEWISRDFWSEKTLRARFCCVFCCFSTCWIKWTAINKKTIWVFLPKIGVPQNGWFIMENLIKMDDLGVPLFSETPTSFLLTACR